MRPILLTLTFISLLVTIAIGETAYAQLSPGDLAEPHALLEGISNCTKCHELGEGPSEQRCLECHRGIADALNMKKGYHTVLVNDQKKSCFECHPDHAGREFKLVQWTNKEQQAAHQAINYPLVGKHATVPCRDCHNPARLEKGIDFSYLGIDPIRTYFGLDTTCLGCHADIHQNQLGTNCTSCHDNNSWKPASGFNHKNTDFQLTGKHKKVDCIKCHPSLRITDYKGKNQNTCTKYKNIDSKSCLSCHKDIHIGKFGDDCVRCHTTNGWKIISEGDFNHDKTKYPLRGKHASLGCDKCHGSKSLTGKLKYSYCTDCHNDKHQSQFANREDKGACESCHTVDKFKPSLFTIDNHQQTSFKLIGAHAAQPCLVCHKIAFSNDNKEYRLFDVESKLCTDCHEDNHRGQFINSEKNKLCEDCHNSESWRIDKFDHNKKSSYTLTGVHLKVQCIECHQTEKVDGKEIVRYRPLSNRCISCHPLGVAELETEGKQND